jgi:hypothetical protein
VAINPKWFFGHEIEFVLASIYPAAKALPDSNGARILRFQPSQEDIDSAIEDYNPKIECVVNYFDDGGTLKLFAEGALKGYRDGSNASLCTARLLHEKSDRISWEQIF